VGFDGVVVADVGTNWTTLDGETHPKATTIFDHHQPSIHPPPMGVATPLARARTAVETGAGWVRDGERPTEAQALEPLEPNVARLLPFSFSASLPPLLPPIFHVLIDSPS
jgi:hypothetical protein